MASPAGAEAMIAAGGVVIGEMSDSEVLATTGAITRSLGLSTLYSVITMYPSMAAVARVTARLAPRRMPGGTSGSAMEARNLA